MNFNHYQSEAMSFRLPSAKLPTYPLFGLPGEVGELCSLVAKGLRDGRKFDHDQNVKKELGDILWMVAAIAEDHGFTLEEIADCNIAKLSARKENNTIQGSGDDR